ncbi:hypothetical protein C8R44DRAFT_787706 [Mycena epipterygia]|nr:hypothetical protein C8R44DRAFT_787706 [Mycena epipterygia]
MHHPTATSARHPADDISHSHPRHSFALPSDSYPDPPLVRPRPSTHPHAPSVCIAHRLYTFFAFPRRSHSPLRSFFIRLLPWYPSSIPPRVILFHSPSRHLA